MECERNKDLEREREGEIKTEREREGGRKYRARTKKKF